METVTTDYSLMFGSTVVIIIVVIIAIKIFKKLIKIFLFGIIVVAIIVALSMYGIIDYKKILHKIIGYEQTIIPSNKTENKTINYHEIA